MKPLFKLLKVAMILTGIIILPGNTYTSISQVPIEQEYAYKAAFIYHFTEYIEWKNLKESRTFNFGVLGESPITPQMESIAREQKVKNKSMTVKKYENLNNIESLHILFIPRNSPFSVKDIANRLYGNPVLIITEHEGYERRDSHINFFISNEKLRFEINLKAANRAGLNISSQLLQHSVIIN